MGSVVLQTAASVTLSLRTSKYVVSSLVILQTKVAVALNEVSLLSCISLHATRLTAVVAACTVVDVIG